MHKGFLFGAALGLTGALVSLALAQTPTPTPTTGGSQMVLQLAGTLADPTMCGSQIIPGSKVVSANLGYGTKEFTNLNYPIALGDFLEYEVLIPSSSTLHGGAVDGDLSGAKASGTIRDAPFTEDQNGLFAHAGSDFDILALRTIPQVDSTGKVTNVPMWAPDQWYKRDIDLSKLTVPKSSSTPSMLMDLFLAVDEHDTTHENDLCPVDPKNANFSALFRNINIKNHDMTGKEVVKMAIYNGEPKLPDGNASDTIKGTAANGTVGVITFSGPNAIAPASNTPFVPASEIGTVTQTPPAGTTPNP